MNTLEAKADAIAKVTKLVQYYCEGKITANFVFSDLADMTAPDNADELIALLPPELKARLREWVRRFPPPDTQEVIFWPLPRRAALALREWLRREEIRDEQRETNGLDDERNRIR
jgi:hypothetical protein